MDEQEKVIKGLEYHLSEITIGKKCFQCPYYGDNPCEQILIASAIELIKDQKRRIKQLREMLGIFEGGEVDD